MGKKEKSVELLLENTGDGIMILTKEGKPLYISPSVRTILGYTTEEGMQLDLISLAHPEDIPIWMDNMSQAIANPGLAITAKPTRMRHTDGTWRWIAGVLTNMLHDPEINGIVDNFRDVTEKVLAEKIVKDSEEKYRSFFDNNQDGILLTIADGKILAANPAACRMFQMTEEESCKAGRFGLVEPSDERVQRGIQERQKHGKAKIEITLVRKDGSTFPAEVTSTVFKDSNGEERTSMIVRDLTEVKRTQKAILELQSNLQSIFDNTSEGFILTDSSGIVKAYNNKAKVIVSTNLEAKITAGTSIFDYIHKDRKENFKIVISKVLSGETINYDHSYKTKDGKLTWLNFTVNPVSNSGKIEGICITGADITQRKETEVSLKQSESRYRQIVETAQEGIWVIDKEDRTIFVNQKMCEILGYSSSEIMGKSSLFFTDDDGLQIAKNNLQRRRQGITETCNSSFVRKDGRLIWTKVSSNPIINDEGIYEGSLCMVADITEKKNADELLHQSEKRYREIAHELQLESARLKEAQAVAKVGSWEIDIPSSKVTWSEEIHPIFETPPNFIPTRSSFVEMIYPGDRVKFDNSFSASFVNHFPNALEYRIITAKGNLKFVEEHWEIFHTSKGEPTRAVGTCQDITERKKAEEELSATYEELRTTSERLLLATTSAQMGIWDWDILNDKMSWNNRIYELYGVGKQHFTDALSVWQTGVHPDDIEKARRELNDAITGINDYDSEFRVVWPDKSVHFIDAHAIVSRCEAGVGVRMIGGNIDITERKAAEEKVETLNTSLTRSKSTPVHSFFV